MIGPIGANNVTVILWVFVDILNCNSFSGIRHGTLLASKKHLRSKGILAFCRNQDFENADIPIAIATA